MKAARLFAARDVRLVDDPPVEVQPGKILLKIQAVAICASDVNMYEDGHSGGVWPDHPMIQGHEFSGVVAALGEGVEGPAVGTRVAVEPTWHCGECDSCRRGLENICRHVIFPSYPNEDGALREYMNCPPFAVHVVDPGVSPVKAALMEPLGVGVHAVRLANLQPGEKIAILGAGTIGMCVMAAAKAYGHTDISVAEPKVDRQELPRKMGARFVAASAEELGELMAEPTMQPDVVFECSGDNEAPQQAMKLARPAGRVVIVGIPHPDEVTFNSTIPRRKELTVTFSRRSRNTLGECVRLVETGEVDLDLFPFQEFKLDDVAEAFKAAQERPEGVLRVIVRCDQG